MNKFPVEFPKICAEFGRGALRVGGVVPKLGEGLGGVKHHCFTVTLYSIQQNISLSYCSDNFKQMHTN